MYENQRLNLSSYQYPQQLVCQLSHPIQCTLLFTIGKKGTDFCLLWYCSVYGNGCEWARLNLRHNFESLLLPRRPITGSGASSVMLDEGERHGRELFCLGVEDRFLLSSILRIHCRGKCGGEGTCCAVIVLVTLAY